MKIPHRLIPSLVLLFVWGAVPDAFSQWSNDPTENLLISATTTSHVQSKIAPTSDGGFYISWMGESGFNVYLQRLDADGVPQWAAGGLLIADRSFSSTEDYGLSVSSDDHALLTYRVNAGGTVQAAAQRVAPDGSLAWGDGGMIVSSTSSGAASPLISSTHDGGAVVAWTSYDDGSITLQRVSSSGDLLWDDGVAITLPSGFFLIADVHGNPDGSVIVSGSAQLSTFDRQLWAQKLDANGNPLWGENPVAIFDGAGGALQFGYFPKFVLDGQGGAVFSWYIVAAPGEGFIRVQHILSHGMAVFPQNGLSIANEPAAWQRTNPVLDYDSASGDIYVAWSENLTSGGVTTFGASAQRIDSDGNLMWGNGGLTLIPMQDIAPAGNPLVMAIPNDGVIIGGTLGGHPVPMMLVATRLTAGGVAMWEDEMVILKSETTGTQVSRPQATLSRTDGHAAFVWSDQIGGSFDGAVRAQNISFSGILGEYDEGGSAPPQAEISDDVLSIVLGPNATETASLTLSNVAPAGADNLNFTAHIGTQETTLVDFEDGTNPYGFTFGYTDGDAVVSIGGNPGFWFENNGLATAIPRLYIEGDNPFIGDYIAERVSNISVDAQTLLASLNMPGRDLSLLLLNYNGAGPNDVDLHKYVYYVFPEGAPQPGDGWKSFSIDIPWNFDGDMPDGWAGGDSWDPENLPDGWTFSDVISSVDEVNIMWGHPAFFYLLQDFHLGVDNVSITKAEEQTVVTVAPQSGSIAPQQDLELEVTFSPDGLPDGTYEFPMVIGTNDPDQPEIIVEVTMIVDSVSDEDEGTPLTFELSPAYPNPTLGVTTIEFALPQAERATLEIFDLSGRRIAVLVNEEMPAGRYSVEWDSASIAAGTYIYRMIAGSKVMTQRITVVK